MKLYNINTLNELENSLNLELVKLEKYVFPTTFAFAVGKVQVRTMQNDIIIYIDENISKDYMSAWYSSVGRLFFNDLRTHKTDNYFTVCYNNVHYLFRLIDDDSKAYCKKKSVKDYDELHLGNDVYMLICVSSDEKFMISDFTAAYKNTQNDATNNDNEDTMEDDMQPEYESLELFNDDIFNGDWDE